MGSYAQLRNGNIPLEERIELSRTILRNSECFLPNKNQVIVDWSCQELANIQRKCDKDGLYEDDGQELELWKLLSEVLNDPGSEQIVLRQKVLPLFFKELDEIKEFLGKYCSEKFSSIPQDQVLSVFSCFKAISKNPNMSLIFFNKLENLEQYMKGILSCFLGVLLQPDLYSANFVAELYHLVIIVLHQYGTTQQQQVSQRKVFTNLCEKLLHMLLLVRTVVRDENIFHFQDLSRDEISSAIESVIISSLFHKDLISSYNPTAIPRTQEEPSPKKSKLVNSYRQLFDALESFATSSKEVIEGINSRPDLVFQTISDSLPFLLENFLKATRGGKLENTSKFSFFVELYNVVSHGDSQTPEVTRTLKKMLNFIVDYDVYQIAEDNANNEPIFKWFLNLMKCELHSQSYDDAEKFYCLDIILKLNHKIIEQSLELVLAKCFSKSANGSKEVEKAKIDLLCGVVETYSKLQQLENLVKCLLKVCNQLASELSTIPVEVLTKLSRSFEHCPFNQTLSISQIFLNEMKDKVQSLQEDRNADIYIEGISILFVTFLLNSSYNAAEAHGLDDKKTASVKELVENIKTAIITPLVKAFPSCKKSSQKQLGFCTLSLVHGLNSLILFLHQHNVIPISEDHYVKLLWDSEVEAYVPDETWKNLALLKRNKRLRFCMELLVVHRVRCLLLKPDFDQNEFDHLIDFLYSFQDPQSIPEFSSVSWNFDLSCVNNINYPVAHWWLVTQYAPLFIPYCNEKQLQSFAEFMIGTMVLEEEENTDDNLITLHQVAQKILKDGELLFSTILQATVVEQFWKKLGEYMSQVVGDKLSSVFSWEKLEDQDIDGEDVARENGEAGAQAGKIDVNKSISLAQSIAEAMNDLVSKSQGKRSKKKADSGGDLSIVAQLLKIFQRLPFYQFTPSDQVRCILGLLACDVLSGKIVRSDEAGPDSPSLIVRVCCRKIITTFLQGLLQRREFSAWRVVEKTSLLRWLYHTIVQVVPAKISSTNLQREFLNVSKELFRFAMILSLKSPSQAMLRTVVDFNKQLVTSLAESIKNAGPEIVQRLDVLFVVASACTESLEQKGKNNSSLRAACSFIYEAVVNLASFTKITLEETNSSHQAEINTELEKMVMRLTGILTRAMRLIPQEELSKNEDFTDVVKGWSEIVSVLVGKVLERMGDEEQTLQVSDETITQIEVLEDVFKGGPGHCDSISEEFKTQILRKCLQILRNIGFQYEKGIADEVVKRTEETIQPGEAVIRLIVTLLEENDGKNYTMVLNGVLEWSTEEREASEDTQANLLTGLSVFRDLLSTKVVKQNRKELRSVTGKIMITLLSRVSMNDEISSAVLEIAAALVSLGSGVFHPRDLALVLQTLALKIEVTSPTFARVFMARFTILSWTLFYYPEFVYGAVHVFLPCVRELLQSLLKWTSVARIESEEASTLLTSVQKMSRLYQEIASHKDVFSKYSIYFLADCVHVMYTQGVPAIIRDVLVQGVHFLFDICNDDALTKLHVYLPSNERELFRSLKEDYTKYHKFKGNA